MLRLHVWQPLFPGRGKRPKKVHQPREVALSLTNWVARDYTKFRFDFHLPQHYRLDVIRVEADDEKALQQNFMRCGL
jgi:hypothetical protein